MRKKHTLICFFESKGMKLRTWAFSMGFSDRDVTCLYDLATGRARGLRGRTKELRKILEKEGFSEGLAKIENGDTDSAKDYKRGA